ncbi:MAG: helix-turn-helix transcriptional regulator [Spirochaetales bacterium]|nr:helix-turn-helix transcriptional regulator [Spirochaetales bacterium]
MDLISIENHENTKLGSEDFQFNIFRIKDLDTPPHWHNHSEIIYLQEGRALIYINGSVNTCSEGDLLFIPSGHLHSIVTEDSAQYHALVIGERFLDDIRSDKHSNEILSPFFSESIKKSFHINRSDSSYSGIIKPIKSILNEENEGKPGFELIIKIELCRFFTELIRNFPDRLAVGLEDENRPVEKMKNVIEYIFVHFHEKITISLMSNYSHMSDQHFCRVFKAYTGSTFINFLTDYRLEQANQLLKSTDLPITNIPEITGFCNGNYFARVYKNKFGHPPSFLRKKNKNSIE